MNDKENLAWFLRGLATGYASDGDTTTSVKLKKAADYLDIFPVVNHDLYNILAVIHRDGGHYTAKHGLEKSVKDAQEIVIKAFATLAELEERNAERLTSGASRGRPTIPINQDKTNTEMKI
jgi:hypothetical protein